MTTTEHLSRIRDKCVELLEIAEKRTPGKWDAFQRGEEIGTEYCRITFTDRRSDSLHGYCGKHNARFIAACAGPAEAGWRATIAAIDWITQFSLVDLSPCNGGSCMVATEVDERLDSIRAHFTNNILAAWPEELL